MKIKTVGIDLAKNVADAAIRSKAECITPMAACRGGAHSWVGAATAPVRLERLTPAAFRPLLHLGKAVADVGEEPVLNFVCEA